MSQVKATAKGLRISSRKLGLVAALVRGRSVEDSLVILEHTPKRGAPYLAKVIKSAAANAQNNAKVSKDGLEVSQVLVSPGSTIKRFRAGSRGYVDPQRHRSAHVTVIVDSAAPQTPAVKSKATTGSGTAPVTSSASHNSKAKAKASPVTAKEQS